MMTEIPRRNSIGNYKTMNTTEKMNMKRKILYAVTLLTVTSALFGCTILGVPKTSESGSDVITSENTPSVSGDWNAPENASEAASAPIGPVRKDAYDPDGFYTLESMSFAGRAEGLYEQKGNPGSKLEIYEVGGNLYGFVDTEDNGFAAVEFFADNADDFVSPIANSFDVSVLTFSIQSNLTQYWSGGNPATFTMSLTEEGIAFKDLGSGNESMLETSEYIRLDEEMGHLNAFCYRSEDYDIAKVIDKGVTEEIPAAIPGMWRILGDNTYAPMVEFTDDHLVQVYMKNASEEVVLLRGNYAQATEYTEGQITVSMVLVGLGNGSSPAVYNLTFSENTDGTLSCHDGDFSYGEDLFWDGAMLIPIGERDLPVYTKESLGKASLDVTYTPGNEDKSDDIYSPLGFWTLTDITIGDFYAVEFKADRTWNAYLIEPISSHFVPCTEGEYVSGTWEEAEGGRGYKAYSLKNEDGNFVTVAQVYSDEDDENSDVRMCFQDGHIFERFY